MIDYYASTEILSLQVEIEGNEEQQIISAPAVGVFSNPPRTGDILAGGSFVGKLKTLNSCYHLFLPQDVSGQVLPNDAGDLVYPVEYKQELFRLTTDTGLIDEKIKDASGSDLNENEGYRENGFVVNAFTTGIFYAQPSPDSPPFVTLGQEIEKGKALGLIEVMKTFNHIVFQGTGESSTGTIKKIFVKDSQEVKQGQPLFLII
jgi:biotin carboxyl carrier protein